MKVDWRGSEYEFYPRAINGGTDNYTKFSNIDALIFGSDTESVQLDDRYEPLCFTFSDEREEHLVYLPERSYALRDFLRWFCGNYFDECVSVGHAIIYYHNLEYDWLQLIKTDERLLEMAKIGVGLDEDMTLIELSPFKITLKKNPIFAGSAPHMKLRIKKGNEGFTLYIYDTFSFFPSSLAKLSKTVGIDIEKMERQEDLGKVDYRGMKDCEDKRYFEEYAKLDAKITRLAGEKIRELHRQAGMTKIRASAPAYAIHSLFHMMEEHETIVTGSHDPRIMQLIFDTYRGGRTGGIYHGEVDQIAVYDFHSSYPASMLSLPSFNENMGYILVDDLGLDNVLSILDEVSSCFLRVSGIETDDKYPALITTINGKLTPITGEFKEVATTGIELLVGLKSGTLTITEVHEMVVLLDMDDDPKLPFKEFASNAYKRKENSEKGSVEYTSAKLALNSAYGKLIESRSQTLIGASDYRARLPFIPTLEREFGNYYYKKYVEFVERGTTLGQAYDEIMDELLETFSDEDREEFVNKMFGDFNISGKIYGRYVIPAGASLITATSRARLCVAMKCLDALYWDTDSVFITGLTEEEVKERLSKASGWLPKNVVPVQIGDKLGELDSEIDGATGYLAGVKRYYLEDRLYQSEQYDEDNKRLGETKTATHGIPALPFEYRKDVIKSLATGSDFRYTSKPKPMKAKESKTSEEIGSFQKKSYLSSFHLDERLTWTKTKNGWNGTVNPFSTFQEQEPNEEQKQLIEGMI